jgi:hypothetical protein
MPYKFLFLIIDSSTHDAYAFNREIIKKYMHSHPSEIKTLFIRLVPTQTEEYILEEDTLTMKGTESLVPGILEKTLKAMEYVCRHFAFDYVIRSNMSSLWDFQHLLALYDTLPRETCVSAIIGEHPNTQFPSIRFPSGSGFIVSRDIVELCIGQKDMFVSSLPDDVAFGKFFVDRGIPLLQGRRYDILTNRSFSADELQSILSQKHYHYRIKYEYDRTYDKHAFQLFYRCLYDPYKTTLVSFFFNLHKLKDATFLTRPFEFYLENGKEVLSQPYPMVLFCDEDTVNVIRERRNTLCPANITTYIVKNITEYDIYRETWDIIKHNRERQGTYTDARNTPSYCITTVFKINAMRIAHSLNPFQTPYFAWIDFGCAHICRDMSASLPAILENPKPKIAMTYIHYRSAAELDSMETYLHKGGPCSMAAGFFTIESAYIIPFYTACMSIYYEMLHRGVGHSEEAVITYCYTRYPHLFTLTYADYYSLFTNYLFVTQDYGCIQRFFIDVAKQKGRADLAHECAQTILASIAAGKLTLSSRDIEYLNNC